ncbi:MAG: TonB C-terminal domain-containing protein [Candidatus Dependentiae bacterium]|nr:TonB C-terminal domain-containing protein [Candidatus Dependentiae bacterium]
MLHLLPSVLSKKIHFYFSPRRVFLAEILLFVFFSHIIILGLMIFVSSLEHKPEQFAISLSHTGQTYVLMPLSKKESDFQMKQKIGKSGVYKKSKVIDYQTYQKHKQSKKNKKAANKKVTVKKSATNKKNPAGHVMSKQVEKKAQKVEAKEASLSLKSFVKPKTELKAKAKKKIVIEKSEKKKIFEKSIVSKKAVISEVALAKEPAQQEIIKLEEPVEKEVALTPQPEAVIPNIVEPEIVDVGKVDIKEIPVKDQPEDLNVGEAEGQDDSELIDDDIDLENVVFLGRDQFDNSIVASKLKQAVEQCWVSPVGIKKGTTCQMRVHVGQKGDADDVKVIQSSKIIMFDLPARKALFSMKYPKEVWNKTITIALGA